MITELVQNKSFTLMTAEDKLASTGYTTYSFDAYVLWIGQIKMS